VLLLPAAITKTHEARDVPMTHRLEALLAMRRHGPDGVAHGGDRFVFGNEVGERVKYWRVNTAWHATCAAAGIDVVAQRVRRAALRRVGDARPCRHQHHESVSEDHARRFAALHAVARTASHDDRRAEEEDGGDADGEKDSHTIRTRREKRSIGERDVHRPNRR
jgi:hypothetical protein